MDGKQQNADICSPLIRKNSLLLRRNELPSKATNSRPKKAPSPTAKEYIPKNTILYHPQKMPVL